MSAVARQITNMVDMLPQSEQELAFELIKRMVIAWDGDFTKLTPLETVSLANANKEVEEGNVIKHEEMDWN